MLVSSNCTSENRNKDIFFQLLLLAVLIFQVTTLRFTLDIRTIGRIVNICLLIFFAGQALITCFSRHEKTLIYRIIAPSILIIAGYGINLCRNFDINNIGYFGVLFPLFATIYLPFMRTFNLDVAWKLFYYFMLVTTFITVVEYYFVFYESMPVTEIETDGGFFGKGFISLYHMLYDGATHYRYYGVFAEPGTGAMFLLSAITYSIFFRKFIGCSIFLLALYLTDSLGGFLGLFILVGTLFLWKSAATYTKIASFCAVAAFAMIFNNWFMDAYELKVRPMELRSGIGRVENVTYFLRDLSASLLTHPFGFDYVGSTYSNLDKSNDYYGSNFTFYLAFVQGGILSFTGYVWLFFSVLVSLLKAFSSHGAIQKTAACAFVSLPALLSFCVQRGTILETSLFAFLYAFPILATIRSQAPDVLRVPKVKVSTQIREMTV